MILTPDKYIHRLAEPELELMLESFGAVCVEGPKFSGKTWFSMNSANSMFAVNDPRNNYSNRTLATTEITDVFVGEIPHLIDEWQEVPAIWDATKIEVDKSSDNGRYILTGSSTPRLKGVTHSGAGRIGRMRIRTMSLYESGDSDGSVSLRSLFDSTFNTSKHRETSLRELISLTVRGGWPRNIGMDDKHALIANKGYLDTIVEDAVRLDGKSRNKKKIDMLLRSLSRNESTLASHTKIAEDINEYEGETTSMKSVAHYLDVLERLFITCDQPSFSSNLRSSTRIGKSPKRHLCDPSLAVAAMDLNAEKLLSDLNTYGFLFEAMCERDLDVYTRYNGGRIYHYRDDLGYEIDAAIEMPDGKWGAFEIRLGADRIDDAAKNLLKIRDRMESDGKARAPSVLCVVCGCMNYAYRRADGVYVVPVMLLGP